MRVAAAAEPLRRMTSCPRCSPAVVVLAFSMLAGERDPTPIFDNSPDPHRHPKSVGGAFLFIGSQHAQPQSSAEWMCRQPWLGTRTALSWLSNVR